jgi:hypothetical protein
MITTGEELRHARESLGWSCYQLGLALGLTGDRIAIRKRVDEMETDARNISGPVGALMEAFVQGFRPSHFNPDTDDLPP